MKNGYINLKWNKIILYVVLKIEWSNSLYIFWWSWIKIFLYKKKYDRFFEIDIVIVYIFLNLRNIDKNV